MTTTRTLALAAATLAVLAAGCGDKKCGDATPVVGTLNTSATCTAPAGAPVTVKFHVCPQCDQGTPECIVHAENAAAGQITLEPVAEVCDPKSCDILTPQSCQIPTLNCSFTAPPRGPVNVTIVTSTGQESFSLAISGTGATPVTCTL